VHQSASRIIRAASLMAIVAASAGCQRTSDTPSEAPQPAAAQPAVPPPPVEPRAEPEVPAGVLQAYVWTCDDGQTIRMRNLLRESAITIEMHEGGRKLPLVASASGAKYSDGSLTFWTKGDTAMFERPGSATVNCTQNRFESLLADARVRGVTFRGTGNEGGTRVYSATGGERSIKVTVTTEPCTDDMSGWAFDHRMVVEFDGQTLRGCATALP
jgi:membrane-bound inhibitor of C-type lysozyme